MTTLFISDLHLDPGRPAATAAFLELLRTEAREAEALYILGDLFEAWVGDDEDGELANTVRDQLRVLVEQGVPVFVQRGNRDFLLGADFAAATGATLLPDPAVILLDGEPALLMHGDLLCTGDAAYQAFRRQVRDPEWQARFLAQPLPARRAFAEQARQASRAHQDALKDSRQLETIADVTPSAVAATMSRFGVRRLIHGHTHRPAIHTIELGAGLGQRVVLGDWYEQGSVLRADADGLALAAIEL